METAVTAPRQKIITKIEANPALASRKNSNRPLNVAAYCRVSTDAEDQINSYRAQVSYYTEHINQNPKWRFVNVYADEGITGTMVKKRDGFLKMIRDCEKGKIDMILTKSVSRFARNIVDSISYVRKLKAMGIGIYFEEQNIDSLKEDSETYIGIYSVMAQSESENISANISWGIRKRMQNGTYACRFNMLGYRKEKGETEPRIIPEEAEVVRNIFKMYDEGHSLDQIKAYLESKSIKTPTGKPVWSKENIRKMLTNEKYVGDVIYQKTYRTDCISKHTKINRGERTKYLVSNNHPAIVDRDLFNAVQAELVRRSSKRKTSDKTLTSLGKYSGKYALSELLICAECGSPYKRKTWTQGDEKRIYWRCLSRIEHGKKYCPYSKGLEENKLHSAICRALKATMNENAEALALIKANLAYAVTGDEANLDLGAIEKRIKEATKEMENYMASYRNTGGDKTRYLECIQKVADEIKSLRAQEATAKAKLEKSTEVNSEIKRLCDWLDSHDTSFSEYDDMVIRRVVECIKVFKDGTIKVITKFGTEATETV